MSNLRHDYHKSHAHRIDFRNTSQHTRISSEISDFGKDWKKKFLSHPQNKWFCDIPNEYIEDVFNTFGLNDEFLYFRTCCDIILGKLSAASLPINQAREICSQLPQVYGMIHARFILSPDGLISLAEKYDAEIYGTCPRIFCHEEPLLPIGLSSKPNESKVKAFCPICREIYEPRPKNDLDGAYFGPNAAHLFLDQMKMTVKMASHEPFIHKAFGFRIRSPNFEVEKVKVPPIMQKKLDEIHNLNFEEDDDEEEEEEGENL
ncbi:Casein kinase II subunit beta-2 [Tritrichomonas foetus]|uniref:Casein kinase II subunit beta n=1 Tax=Tritrichomonas foetus TaxID=1144522 RepID=A0A1J4J950_9EUKA|nr:Casein kinase II subunit beta-2 [Tritrichomonas foetus]|eukprot:OHS95672.1 Casein kinase II subunit beta-2 [Tritrichomonas foetus]